MCKLFMARQARRSIAVKCLGSCIGIWKDMVLPCGSKKARSNYAVLQGENSNEPFPIVEIFFRNSRQCS